MIGDTIEITIVDVKGDKVRVGINAPLEIPVHRKEIYDAIKRENIVASTVDTEPLAAAAGLFRQARTRKK
jgi:carbon storage regulator